MLQAKEQQLIDLQRLDENGKKYLRNAKNGKELKEEILSFVATNVSWKLYKINCEPLENDDIYTYLKRHGQRGNPLHHQSFYLSLKILV